MQWEENPKKSNAAGGELRLSRHRRGGGNGKIRQKRSKGYNQPKEKIKKKSLPVRAYRGRSLDGKSNANRSILTRRPQGQEKSSRRKQSKLLKTGTKPRLTERKRRGGRSWGAGRTYERS